MYSTEYFRVTCFPSDYRIQKIHLETFEVVAIELQKAVEVHFYRLWE